MQTCTDTAAGPGSSAWAALQTVPDGSAMRGLQTIGNPWRMRRFMRKVLQGDNVTISVAGGSVSRGWADDDKLEANYKGYFGRFVKWMQTTFTQPEQEIVNGGGAVGAVMSPMYAACTSQMVRPSSDLVFVEFVQNDLYKGSSALSRGVD